MTSPVKPKRFSVVSTALAIVGLAGIIIVTGATVLRTELTEGRAGAQRQIQAVGQLKAQELEAWRNERIVEARFLHSTPAVATDVMAALRDPDDQAAVNRLKGWMQSIKGGSRYESVLLFDPHGNLVVSLADTPESAFAPTAAEFHQTLASQQISVGRLARGGPKQRIFIDLLVPIRPESTPPTDSAAGVIVLRIDPEHFLFPLIRTWPLKTASAESILIRREGDEVVFLNQLRHRADPPLSVRLPITDPNFTAGRAARGEVGVIEGNDYRGVPVLSSIHPIAGSPWILLAEIDVAEVYAPIHSSTWKTGLLLGLFLLVLALFMVGTWRRHQTAYLQRAFTAEVQRNAIADRLALITQHVNDAVFLFDEHAQILEANNYAQSLYGRSLAELRQLHAADLRGPDSTASTAADFAHALTPAGIRFETLHRRADGSLFPVETNAKLVMVEGRRHVLSIVRDITERRAQEQEIERLNRIYLVLSRINQLVVRTRSRQELLDRVCSILVEAGGFKIAWMGWRDLDSDVLRPTSVAGDEFGYVANLKILISDKHPEGRGPSGTAFREGRVYVCNDFHRDPVTVPWREAAARSGIAASISLPVLIDGKPAGLLTAYASTPNFFGHREIPLLEQIAGDVAFALEVLSGDDRRRNAETSLRESENRLQFLLTATPAVIYSLRTSEDFGTTFISANVKEVLGYHPDDFLADPDFWLSHVHPEDRGAVAADFSKLLKSGRSVREYRFLHRDGSYRWMHDEVRLVPKENGFARDLVGYWVDITPRKQAEDNLRKLSRIVEQAPLSIAITDLTGAINYVNPKFLEVTGYTMSEVLGQNPRMLKSGQTPTATYTEMWATLTRGHVWQGQLHNRRKNGDLYIEHAVIAPVVNEVGQATHYVALKQDITEIERTAAALREAQNRYQLIANNSADVIWLYDPVKGQITYCSPSLRNLLGYEAEDIAGQSLAQFMAPASADFISTTLPLRLAARTADPSEPVTWSDEVEQMHRNGTPVPTEVVTTLLVDDTGQVSQVLGISRDITDRVKARAALQRFSNELEFQVADRTAELAKRNLEVQALLRSIPDTVLRVRTDGTLLFHQAAPGGATQAGAGENVSPLHDVPTILGSSLAISQQAIAAGNMVAAETEIKLPSGAATVELRVTPSGPDEVVVLARDITARKRLEVEITAMLEKERQVSEMKTRFISVTSHEFRTPMAAAMGSVELLHNHFERLTPEKREELFGRITTAMNRLTEMLDDVLTLNRMDANRIEKRLTKADLRLFLQNTVEEFRLADRNNHVFALTFHPDEATPFVTDISLLHHIISNLLSNAVRYSPSGTTITATMTAVAHQMVITLEDEGIGIPEADRARIFEPFERASNVGNIKGTGLGLNIVKRMTEMLGGTITLASAPSGGCCFTLTLPHLPQPPASP